MYIYFVRTSASKVRIGAGIVNKIAPRPSRPESYLLGWFDTRSCHSLPGVVRARSTMYRTGEVADGVLESEGRIHRGSPQLQTRIPIAVSQSIRECIGVVAVDAASSYPPFDRKDEPGRD